jgi:UDP-N-acetyl-D-glucosamine dehydrogenase
MAIMTNSTASPLADLKHKMETREARIGIVGMGYVGLPLALLFSGERFRVTGFDIEPDKVATLNSGGSYIVRILTGRHPGSKKGGLPRHGGLLRDRPNGCGHHLRAHPAQRAP